MPQGYMAVLGKYVGFCNLPDTTQTQVDFVIEIPYMSLTQENTGNRK